MLLIYLVYLVCLFLYTELLEIKYCFISKVRQWLWMAMSLRILRSLSCRTVVDILTRPVVGRRGRSSTWTKMLASRCRPPHSHLHAPVISSWPTWTSRAIRRGPETWCTTWSGTRNCSSRRDSTSSTASTQRCRKRALWWAPARRKTTNTESGPASITTPYAVHSAIARWTPLGYAPLK